MPHIAILHAILRCTLYTTVWLVSPYFVCHSKPVLPYICTLVLLVFLFLTSFILRHKPVWCPLPCYIWNWDTFPLLFLLWGQQDISDLVYATHALSSGFCWNDWVHHLVEPAVLCLVLSRVSHSQTSGIDSHIINLLFLDKWNSFLLAPTLSSPK